MYGRPLWINIIEGNIGSNEETICQLSGGLKKPFCLTNIWSYINANMTRSNGIKKMLERLIK